MKMTRAKPRTDLRRCPATGSDGIYRRLSNALAAEKRMPTEDGTTGAAERMKSGETE